MEKKVDIYTHRTEIIIAVLILFIVCVTALFGYFKVKSMNRRIRESEEKIAEMEIRIQPSSGASDQTEYARAVEFLENETAKYREFIQEQQEYLIWLLGVVGAAFLALMSFLGFESRKNISDMFQKHYAKLVKDEFSKVIGGADREEYLIRCIEKEERAKNKKILFLKQDRQDEDFEKIYDFLEKQKYCVSEKKIKVSEKEKKIDHLIKDCDVVVYQVGKSEYNVETGANAKGATVGTVNMNAQCGFNGETAEEKNYMKIAKRCNEKKIYGIFYCTGGGRLTLDKCNFPFYVSSVNFGATLLERINSVLYFTQE